MFTRKDTLIKLRSYNSENARDEYFEAPCICLFLLHYVNRTELVNNRWRRACLRNLRALGIFRISFAEKLPGMYIVFGQFLHVEAARKVRPSLFFCPSVRSNCTLTNLHDAESSEMQESKKKIRMLTNIYVYFSNLVSKFEDTYISKIYIFFYGIGIGTRKDLFITLYISKLTKSIVTAFFGGILSIYEISFSFTSFYGYLYGFILHTLFGTFSFLFLLFIASIEFLGFTEIVDGIVKLKFLGLPWRQVIIVGESVLFYLYKRFAFFLKYFLKLHRKYNYGDSKQRLFFKNRKAKPSPVCSKFDVWSISKTPPSAKNSYRTVSRKTQEKRWGERSLFNVNTCPMSSARAPFHLQARLCDIIIVLEYFLILIKLSISSIEFECIPREIFIEI